MTISKIQKLIDKDLLVIKDDYYGIIVPNSLIKIPKKEMDEQEIEDGFSGINFTDNGNRFPIEMVEIFTLTKVEIS